MNVGSSSIRLFWCLVFLFHCTYVIGNSIIVENKRTGSADWWEPQSTSLDYPNVMGFSTKFSYFPGETIEFKIDFNMDCDETLFELHIYRLGYYGGLGGRLIDTIPLKCMQQKPCYFEEYSRMVDCQNWKISAKYELPEFLPSGVYLAFVKGNPVTSRSYIPFVVKKSWNSFNSDILFKTSDLTWVAYNKFGGWNVYRGNGSFDFSSRAYKASYNRPFLNRLPKPRGQHENFILGSEFPFLFWLEKFGYDVSYVSCFDVEVLAERGRLQNTYVRTLLSVGHDEYWSPGLRKAFLLARNEGVNLAFFSGNEAYWRIEWQNSSVLDSISSSGTNEHLVSSTDVNLISIKGHNNVDTFLTNEDAVNSGLSFDSSPRIFHCAKESIGDEIPFTSKSNSNHWTGTFLDPRRPKSSLASSSSIRKSNSSVEFRVVSEPSQSLTGQAFLVNGYRRDYFLLRREDRRHRIWRDSLLHQRAMQFPYRTSLGVLGYEWDVVSWEDYYLPSGIHPLSYALSPISNGLMEHWGASYRGTGWAHHALTLYRHYHRKTATSPTVSSATAAATTSTTTSTTSSTSTTSTTSTITTTSNATFSTALVFGAGTSQWSWALSSWHDDDPVRLSSPSRCWEDAVLQQATLNLLADMSCFPSLHAPLARRRLPLNTLGKAENIVSTTTAATTATTVTTASTTVATAPFNATVSRKAIKNADRLISKIDHSISPNSAKIDDWMEGTGNTSILSSFFHSSSVVGMFLSYPTANLDYSAPISWIQNPPPSLSLSTSVSSSGSSSIYRTIKIPKQFQALSWSEMAILLSNHRNIRRCKELVHQWKYYYGSLNHSSLQYSSTSNSLELHSIPLSSNVGMVEDPNHNTTTKLSYLQFCHPEAISSTVWSNVLSSTYPFHPSFLPLSSHTDQLLGSWINSSTAPAASKWQQYRRSREEHDVNVDAEARKKWHHQHQLLLMEAVFSQFLSPEFDRIAIRGQSRDVGGGKVSSVEVGWESIHDDAQSPSHRWQIATGKERWSTSLSLFFPEKCVHGYLSQRSLATQPTQDSEIQISPQGWGVIPWGIEGNFTLSIWSRAIDDSGWIEGFAASLNSNSGLPNNRGLTHDKNRNTNSYREYSNQVSFTVNVQYI